jgi:hypothetical protein
LSAVSVLETLSALRCPRALTGLVEALQSVYQPKN